MEINAESERKSSGRINPQKALQIIDSERLKICIALASIVIVSFIAYLPVFHNGFLNWDDKLYIENNPLVHSFNIIDIFSQSVLGNYHPLTILTLAAEYHLFGLNPAGYHGVNLLLHLLNVLLVFYAVYLLSDKAQVALVASLLFGIHPLHVESVAWASELKDLLYTFFFLASYIFYLKYLKRITNRRSAEANYESKIGGSQLRIEDRRKPITNYESAHQHISTSAHRHISTSAHQHISTSAYQHISTSTHYYILALVLFTFSLLSKAMAASLPLILILTDYFKGRIINSRDASNRVFIEKAPFFLLAVVFGVAAIYAQKSFGYTELEAALTIPQRIVFASYGFITYLVKFLFPLNLSAFYPYPVNINGIYVPVHYYAYLILSLGLVAYIIYTHRFTKKIIFGMGFFTITILLVLQLLPVGKAVMADRYSYIPSIGIFYLAGEGFMLLWNNKQKWPAIFLLSVAAVLFSVKTYARCGVWKNDMTLWNDVISQDKTVEEAYYQGYFLDKKGNNEAVKGADRAGEVKDDDAEEHFKKGTVLAGQFSYDEAIKEFSKAIELNPDYAEAYNKRGIVYVNEKKPDEAVKDFTRAIDLNPDLAPAYNNRGIVYFNEKRNEEALNDFNKAIELKPDYALAYNNKGNVLYEEKKYKEAVSAYSKAVELKPDYVQAYYKRGMAEYYSGNKDAACQDLKQAADFGFAPAVEALARYCK